MTSATGDTPNAGLIEAVEALVDSPKAMKSPHRVPMVSAKAVIALIRQHTQPVAVEQAGDEAALSDVIQCILERHMHSGSRRQTSAIMDEVRPYLRPTTQATGTHLDDRNVADIAQPAVALEQGVEHQHCTNCGKPFEVTSDTAFLCRDCLRPTTQATGGDVALISEGQLDNALKVFDAAMFQSKGDKRFSVFQAFVAMQQGGSHE